MDFATPILTGFFVMVMQTYGPGFLNAYVHPVLGLEPVADPMRPRVVEVAPGPPILYPTAADPRIARPKETR